jgi:hypothetical protein
LLPCWIPKIDFGEKIKTRTEEEEAHNQVRGRREGREKRVKKEGSSDGFLAHFSPTTCSLPLWDPCSSESATANANPLTCKKMIFRVSIIILLLLLLLQLLFCNSLSFFFPSQIVSSVCYYGSGCFLLQISPWCILFRFTIFFDLLLLFSSVPKFHSLRIKVSFSISSSFLQCGISFLMVDLVLSCFSLL